MRSLALFATLLVFAASPLALAQTVINGPTDTPGSGASAGKPARPYRPLARRFEEANATHDGHLTLDQARVGMPRIAQHFDEIDTDKRGYVTMDQVRTYATAWRRAHPDGVASSKP